MQSVSQKVSYHQRYNVIVTEIFYYIQIIYYVQILSYHSHIFFDTNVFRYTLVLFFSDTNIFKRTNLTCAPKSPKVKWLKLFTHRIIYKENYFPFLFQLCFNFQLYHTSKIQHLTSNIKPNVKNLIQTCSYIQIFSDTDIGSYHIRIICLIQMYWDIHSYNFWSYKYIRIFAHILNICLDINIFKYLYQTFIFVTPCCGGDLWEVRLQSWISITMQQWDRTCKRQDAMRVGGSGMEKVADIGKLDKVGAAPLARVDKYY